MTRNLQRERHLPSVWCIALLVAALAGCSEQVDLQAGMKDTEANEIVTVLNRQGIEAHKHPTKEGITISIERNDLSRATDALQAAGLPRRNLANLGQVFKKEGMISTPLEERVRYIYGLSEELEYTLQQFDHVLSARVHVVLPERIAPGEPIQPSSAAVFIKYVPPFDEDTALPRIRNLVASSIPGLSGEEGRAKVSVVMMPSEVATPAVEWRKIGPFSVQKKSADLLISLLIGTGVLAACVLGLLSKMAYDHRGRIQARIRQRLSKLRAARAARGEAA